ncbi:Glycosyltransferase involved in cell wall bisynthesis [Rhodoblastus acidophilus]|uniref:Glycosyltransferase involved in cell wall bisynthesis n=1 Tax=Rhodoblastus acidophilus TaxID=1074 RepID=A0A212RT84_RHOAC|nr:glycosyltransferase family 2 protein [Rhodoblastus acidophilus]PPQ40703.1 glycosyltransferase [Rhodoblastus acidophilus]RAI21919.1 glycosyltransferase [Rhodoblastus acidophilus]SNB75741.1 Glycosyltransferase involved in cell wall bisynthesis [Rhodoblastus acidophilus]
MTIQADETPELSVIIPVFNEGDNLRPLAARLIPALACVESFEIVFVDDGSRDNTMEVARELNASDPRITAVSFSRNFGKEIAIAAGVDAARGRGAVIMDADLQHPPEAIALFVEKWREGYQNIFGVRRSRDTDSAARKWLTAHFYRLFRTFGEIGLPEGAGDFRLLDRVALDALKTLREQARFSKGLYAWIGFKSIGVPFDVAERHAGESKFSYRKLTRFALDGLVSFSTVPLKVWTYFGMAIAAFALANALYYVVETLIWGVSAPGFATLVVSITFFAGVQLISLGVLGEYIGRVFAEVKGRPLYLVQERVGGPRGAAVVGAPAKSVSANTVSANTEKAKF